MDAQHVGDLATAILSLAAWQALVVRMAQTGDQVPAQLTHGLGVDAVVDGLVRHAVLMPFGIQASERQGFSLAHSGTQSITGHRDDIFFAAIETARMPILVTDPRLPDNPIVFVNRAFISMTGYSVQEVMGQNCRFLQGPDTDPSSVAAIRAAIDDRHEISLELLNYRKDGTSFWNALYISPIFGQHKELVYFFASQLDVTRRRNAETALGHAQKMEALGQLTGAIAHDFNNLLQVMSGHVELLEVRRKAGSVTDAALERDLIDVRSAIGKTSTLTQQLLAFSREQRLEGRLANLNTLVGELTAW